MKIELIEHLKEVQKDLQTKIGYGEINGNNDLVNYYNENWLKYYDKEFEIIKTDFYHLCLTFESISSHSNQGHWRGVMSTQIGWFLSIHDTKE